VNSGPGLCIACGCIAHFAGHVADRSIGRQSSDPYTFTVLAILIVMLAVFRRRTAAPDRPHAHRGDANRDHDPICRICLDATLRAWAGSQCWHSRSAKASSSINLRGTIVMQLHAGGQSDG
jgi:hypothetical protein